jgi:hypothetical protein
VIATAFFVAIVAARALRHLSGIPSTSGAGILSVLLVVALPIVDMALCRRVAAAARVVPELRPLPGFVAAYEPCFAAPFTSSSPSSACSCSPTVGRQPVRRGAGEHGRQDLELALRCLHRAAALLPAVGDREDGDRSPARRRVKQGPDVPASRLQTLLPLLRGLILVTIVVMATMSSSRRSASTSCRCSRARAWSASRSASARRRWCATSSRARSS